MRRHRSRAGNATLARWLTGAGALVAVVLLSALPAAAHDQLVETTPAVGSTVPDAPRTLALRFNNAVTDVSAQVVVRSPSGAVIPDTVATVDGTLVSTSLPPKLTDGTYRVAWRVVSADGAPIQGTFAFSIGAPSATAPSDAPAVTTTVAAPPAAEDAGTPSPVLWVILGAAFLLAASTAVVLRRPRRGSTP